MASVGPYIMLGRDPNAEWTEAAATALARKQDEDERRAAAATEARRQQALYSTPPEASPADTAQMLRAGTYNAAPPSARTSQATEEARSLLNFLPVPIPPMQAFGLQGAVGEEPEPSTLTVRRGPGTISRPRAPWEAPPGEPLPAAPAQAYWTASEGPLRPYDPSMSSAAEMYIRHPTDIAVPVAIGDPANPLFWAVNYATGGALSGLRGLASREPQPVPPRISIRGSTGRVSTTPTFLTGEVGGMGTSRVGGRAPTPAAPEPLTPPTPPVEGAPAEWYTSERLPPLGATAEQPTPSATAVRLERARLRQESPQVLKEYDRLSKQQTALDKAQAAREAAEAARAGPVAGAPPEWYTEDRVPTLTTGQKAHLERTAPLVAAEYERLTTQQAALDRAAAEATQAEQGNLASAETIKDFMQKESTRQLYKASGEPLRISYLPKTEQGPPALYAVPPMGETVPGYGRAEPMPASDLPPLAPFAGERVPDPERMAAAAMLSPTFGPGGFSEQLATAYKQGLAAPALSAGVAEQLGLRPNAPNPLWDVANLKARYGEPGQMLYGATDPQIRARFDKAQLLMNKAHAEPKALAQQVQVQAYTPQDMRAMGIDPTRIYSTRTDLPSAAELLALYRTGKGGADWYNQARPTMARMFGQDADLFGRIFAALSPRNPVPDNINQALDVYTMIKRGATWEDLFRSVPLEAHRANLVRALYNLPFDASGSQKVSRFGENVLGNLTPVTNDTWMQRILGMKPRSQAAVTPLSSEEINREATRAGITPEEMQATIEQWRPRLREDDALTKQNRADIARLQQQWQDAGHTTKLPQSKMGAVGSPEYRFMEDWINGVANLIHVPPAEMQAALWVGGKLVHGPSAEDAREEVSLPLSDLLISQVHQRYPELSNATEALKYYFKEGGGGPKGEDLTRVGPLLSPEHKAQINKVLGTSFLVAMALKGVQLGDEDATARKVLSGLGIDNPTKEQIDSMHHTILDAPGYHESRNAQEAAAEQQ